LEHIHEGIQVTVLAPIGRLVDELTVAEQRLLHVKNGALKKVRTINCFGVTVRATLLTSNDCAPDLAPVFNHLLGAAYTFLLACIFPCYFLLLTGARLLLVKSESTNGRRHESGDQGSRAQAAGRRKGLGE